MACVLIFCSCSTKWGRAKFSDPVLQQKFVQQLEQKNIEHELQYNRNGDEFVKWEGESQEENVDLIHSITGPIFGIEFENGQNLNEFAEILENRNIPLRIKSWNQIKFITWDLRYNNEVYNHYYRFKASKNIKDPKKNYCTQNQITQMTSMGINQIQIDEKCSDKFVIFDYLYLSPNSSSARNVSYDSTLVSMGAYFSLGKSTFDISAENRKGNFTGDRWAIGLDTEIRLKENIISNISAEFGNIEAKELDKEFIQFVGLSGGVNYWFEDKFSVGATIDWQSMTITTPDRNRPEGGGLIQDEAKGSGFGAGLLVNWQMSKLYLSYKFRKSKLGGEIEGDVSDHLLSVGFRFR